MDEGAGVLEMGRIDSDAFPDLVVVHSFSAKITVLFGEGNGTFARQVEISTAPSPASIAITDLNGDSRSDLVVGNEGTMLSVHLGNGDGTFLPRSDYTHAGTARHLAVADVDLDSKLDVVIGGEVHLGNGDGTLGATIPIAVNGRFALGDLNNDGRPDLVCAPYQLAVMLGNGDGTFGPPTWYPFADFDLEIAIGDLNHDDHADVVAGSRNAFVVRWLGNGDGTLASAMGYTIPSAYAMRLALVDNDANLDMVFSTVNSNVVSVIPGDGAGGFEPRLDSSIGNSTWGGLAVGDFNLDGVTDCAISSGYGTVAASLGNGDGTLGARFPVPESSAGSVDATDLNLDGHPDLAVGDYADLDPLPDQGGFGVHFGLGKAYFSALQYLGWALVNSVRAADLSGDGVPDLVVAAQEGLHVCWGDGNGGVHPPTTYALGSVAVAIGDLDGDDDDDLVTANDLAGTVTILLNDGTGLMSDRTDIAGWSRPRDVALADLDHDGDRDLVIADPDAGLISVLLGAGDGAFAGRTDYAAGDVRSIATGDLNGDLHVDVAGAGGDIVLWLGAGNGGLGPAAHHPGGLLNSRIRIQDLNGDGRKDVATLTGDPGNDGRHLISVRWGNGDGTLGIVTNLGTGSGSTFGTGDFVCADVDEDGRADLVVGGYPVTVLPNVGGAVAAPDAPPALLQVSIEGCPRRARLTWRDATDNETSFMIEAEVNGSGDWSLVGSTAANILQWLSDPLTIGDSHAFRVRACNSGGCSISSATVAVMIPTLAPPSSLTVTSPGTSHQLSISWPPSTSPGVTQYKIYRAQGGGSFFLHASTGNTTFQDTELAAGTEYSYRIAAGDGCIVGPAGDPLSGTTAPLPVLLVHGFCGESSMFTRCPGGGFSCDGVPAAKRLGNKLFDEGLTRLYVIDYPHDRSLEEVVPLLEARVDEVLDEANEDQLNIVAHSQGGLISRWLVQRSPGYASKVKNLVMLGTPNHGSEMTRWIIAQAALESPLPPWIRAIVNSLACHLNDPARYDLIPGSWFLNQLNYRDHSGSYDSSNPLLLCATHDPEEISPLTDYWILLGTGGWCSLKGGLSDAVGLCVPHDGVVSSRHADLVSLPGSREAQDTELDPGPSPVYPRATHFDGSEGPCNLEYARHPGMAHAVADILRNGAISPAASVEAVPGGLTASGGPSALGVGDGDAPLQQLYLRVGVIEPGATVSDTIVVDDPGTVVFVQSGEQNGLSLLLRTPLGTTLTAADTALGLVTYSSDSLLHYQTLSVQNPGSGSWIVESTSSPGGAAQELGIEAYARDGARLIVESGAPEVAAGAATAIQTRLLSTAGAVLPALVTAFVHAPDSTRSPLVFHDDGEHGDEAAGDGVFGASYTNAGQTGFHSVEIVAQAAPQSPIPATRRWLGGFVVRSRPDLSIKANEVTVKSVDSVPHDTLEVAAVVRNLGSAPVNGCTIEMREIGQEPFHSSVVTLEPGASTTVASQWVLTAPASTLEVYVVPTSAPGQSRFDNDTARVTVNPVVSAGNAPRAQREVLSILGYPNPSRNAFVVRFTLPDPAEITLRVYDVSGRRLRTLAQGRFPAGLHDAAWDLRTTEGTKAPPGVYFCELRSGKARMASRLVVIR